MHNTPKTTDQRDVTSESNLEMYDFLKAHPTGVLATVSPDGNPHATVIYYSLDDDLNLYFTTKRDTRKHDNIQHHDHVMLTVYEAFSQSAAEITGIAEEVKDTTLANKVFNSTLQASMRTAESSVPPISKVYAGHYVTYMIRPVEIRMATFMQTSSGFNDIYEVVDF